MSLSLAPNHAAEASPRITHSVVYIDKEIAKRWLENKAPNRPVRQSSVARYRNDMINGRWHFDGAPIRFDVNGMMLDGQHRCLAISEIDFTVPILVVRGLPTESQGVMDQGVKRTPGDQLSLAGVKDAAHIASVVKQYVIWTEGWLFRDVKTWRAITATQITEWVAEHPADIAFLASLASVPKQNDAPPSIASAAAIAFGRVDAIAAREFFTLLSRGAGTEGNPIVTLDKRLQRIRRDGLKVTHRDYLALFILAWNLWRGGRTITKFQRPGSGWTEENFPVVSS